MKLQRYIKSFIFLFSLLVCTGGLKANGEITTAPFNQLEPLTQILEKFSERYQIIFSYESSLLKEVKVDFEFRKGESAKAAMSRLLTKTNLRYQTVGSKYYVLHEHTKKANRNAKKLKRKMKQIQKLEERGKLSINKIESNATNQLRNVMVSVSELKQENTVSGVVKSVDGESLIGVNVVIDGTAQGAITDLDGNFTVTSDKEFPWTLVFSYTGFSTQEITVDQNTSIEVQMIEGVDLGTVQVVGSRSYKRTYTETPVAVDVIDIQDLATQNGTVEMSRLLEYMAPSFNATKQSGSDGSDHINPATLRGLGPDQTLVLINGKRRHQTSLVNLFGNRGLGATGTDFNTIPASAIERIEILRDGAAAQYGSDAIAGVINVVLRKGTNKLTGSVTVGGHNPVAPGDFYEEGTPNTPGNFLDTDGDGIQELADDPSFDGVTHKLDANYGFELGKKGGFANFTTEVVNREKTLRPGADYRRGFGEAAIAGFSFFGNAAFPLSDEIEVYAFGGRNYRDTDAYAFTRRSPNNDNQIITSIFPQGYTPRITSIIEDNSLSAGIRRTIADGWSVDLNNTVGTNDFHYFIKNTVNPTLGDASPTDFDAGGHTLTQNTTNLDFSRYFKSSDESGINLAFGMEYRIDNFVMFAGEEASWGEYDTSGLLITSPNQISTGLPSGSRGFGGFAPSTEVDASRSNFALYLDGEYDVSKMFLVSGAVRYENYSDFGSTLIWKLATRVKASDIVSLRAAISTGFRAPSLAQLNFNTVSTDFENGQFFESLLVPNSSTIARNAGIPELKEEESFNVSAGFTIKKGGFSATIDGYLINIEDRVVLTRGFSATDLPFLDNINVTQARFFTNAVDTRSTGIDLVLAHRFELAGDQKLNLSLAGNFNKLEITNVNSRGLDPEKILRDRERSILETGTPASKFALNANYTVSKFAVNLGLVRFGEVSFFRSDSEQPLYNPAMITNLTLTGNFSKNLNLSLGANNLFNVYPLNEGPNAGNPFGGGGFQDPVQMGISGAYYFARLGFSF